MAEKTIITNAAFAARCMNWQDAGLNPLLSRKGQKCLMFGSELNDVIYSFIEVLVID
jgi:hypothetical protein